MVDYSNTINGREAQDTKRFMKSVILHLNPSKEGKTGVPSSSWSTKKKISVHQCQSLKDYIVDLC